MRLDRSACPAFLITIDTEGDDAWGAPREPSTRNGGFIERFQTLCERHALMPTYLTNWEMAGDRAFQELGRDALARGTAEVGMHLHAWHQPPFDVRLTDADWKHTPYLVEYPEEAMRAKISVLTQRLEDVFERRMTSHRAGRWAMNPTYARLLVEAGYVVDCSVTPGVSWLEHLGAPGGLGGSDYRGYPTSAYEVAEDDLRGRGTSGLIEVPMTIYERRRWHRFASGTDGAGVLRRAGRRWWPSTIWLRPRPGNREDLLWVLGEARARGAAYVEFMLHSSELMPGGSPTFATSKHLERAYSDMEALFATARAHGFRGSTLTDYATEWSARGGRIV